MEFTKKQLLTFSIYELRSIGKKIGVKAPTSLTKKNLIDAIVNVQSGLIEPYFSKRGRPRITTVVERNFLNIAETNAKKDYKVNVIKIIDRTLKKVREELIEEFCNEKPKETKE